MAGFLSFRITGTESTLTGLAAFARVMQDLRPFWRDVFAPKYFATVQDLFATGGRARGGSGRFKSGAWAPLSPVYAAWKRRLYPGRPILVREGDLRESLRWGGGGLGPQGFFRPTPLFVTAGTGVKYGRYHQEGTPRMPARPFLPTPDPAVFAPLLQAWLLRNARPRK